MLSDSSTTSWLPREIFHKAFAPEECESDTTTANLDFVDFVKSQFEFGGGI